MGAEKEVRGCYTCYYGGGSGLDCPAGQPACGSNDFYKWRPKVERDPEIKQCCDCENENYCLNHSSARLRCQRGGMEVWTQKIVTVQERVEKALNEVCDKVDAMEDVSKQPHYTRFKIQPLEFCKANDLGYLEGNVIKYVCRYPYKGQAMKDLLKARDYIDHLIKKQKEKTHE